MEIRAPLWVGSGCREAGRPGACRGAAAFADQDMLGDVGEEGHIRRLDTPEDGPEVVVQAGDRVWVCTAADQDAALGLDAEVARSFEAGTAGEELHGAAGEADADAVAAEARALPDVQAPHEGDGGLGLRRGRSGKAAPLAHERHCAADPSSAPVKLFRAYGPPFVDSPCTVQSISPCRIV